MAKSSVNQSRFSISLLVLAVIGVNPSAARTTEPDPAPLAQAGSLSSQNTDEAPLLDAAALEDLVAPVALYPDELLAIMLPAATYPLEIVQAARFLKARETDPELQADEQWDDSIVALLNYPEALGLLNGDLDWTWRLGAAVLNQQPDVVKAVEQFRERAHAAGNLESDEHKVVKRDNGVIEITSAAADEIYVPFYEPARVVYPQTVATYHYYPQSYPVYYYPYSANHSFYAGGFWGLSTAYTIGWYTNHLHVHHHGYRSHPYYGRRYHRSHLRRYSFHSPSHYSRHGNHRKYHGDYWQAGHRHGHRPAHHRSDRRRGGHTAARSDARHTAAAGRGVSTRSALVHDRARSPRLRNRSGTESRADPGKRSARDHSRTQHSVERSRKFAGAHSNTVAGTLRKPSTRAEGRGNIRTDSGSRRAAATVSRTAVSAAKDDSAVRVRGRADSTAPGNRAKASMAGKPTAKPTRRRHTPTAARPAYDSRIVFKGGIAGYAQRVQSRGALAASPNRGGGVRSDRAGAGRAGGGRAAGRRR